MNLQSVHFLRPEWLLALALLIPLLGFAWRRRATSGWEAVCEPHLLRHMLSGPGAKRARWSFAAFAIGWIGACLALAGPSWERLPQPAFVDPARTVFVVGLAPSMDARDVAPSRMARARHKLQDLADQLGAGSAALVVYREEAFAATPLTDDLNVLRELAPLLETNLAPGRRILPARGLEEAVRLLEPMGLAGAHIVLVTDGSDDDPEATEAAASAAARNGARVSVLGIAGASGPLEAVAAAGHGNFAALSADDRDVTQLLEARDSGFGTALSKSERQTDAWRDMGVWLVWVPLLLAPLAFRKGWATALLALLCLQLPAGSAHAGVVDWFQRPDQRAAREFAEEHYDAAAATFEDPAWRAAAQYRAGGFDAAAAELADRPDPESNYNRGNALAQAGQLEAALAAYDASLSARPDDPDAQFNRDLVKRLLEQQKAESPDDASKGGGSGEGQAAQEPAADGSGAASEKSAQSESAQSGADAGRDGAAQQSAGDAADASPDATAQEKSGVEQSPDARASAAQDASESEQSADARASAAQDGSDSEPSAGASGAAEQADEAPPAPDAETTGSAVADADADGKAEPQQDAMDADERAPGSETGELAGSAGQLQAPTDLAQQDRGLSQVPGSAATPLSPEERQTARWMARLPDDPGGLLREKIRRDYSRKLAARQQGDRP